MARSSKKKNGSHYITLSDLHSGEDALSPVATQSSGKRNGHDVARSKVAEGTISAAGSNRSSYEHDRDRIIHSRHFHKLARKTQLLLNPDMGSYRNRLIHTLEVYQLATSMGHRFNLNIHLIEAIALGHDVGHTPFGHAGEAKLDILMRKVGGFHHAAHSVRVLDGMAYNPSIYESEHSLGLNLTSAVREGILKHGWFVNREYTPYHLDHHQSKHWHLASNNDRLYGTVEAQVVALADSIAYLNHDIEDLFNFGFNVFADANKIKTFFEAAKKDHFPAISNNQWDLVCQHFIRLIQEPEARRTKLLVQDATSTSLSNIAEAIKKPKMGWEKLRLIKFSETYELMRSLFYSFFDKHIYVDPRILDRNESAQRTVETLFNHFLKLFKGDLLRLPLHIEIEMKASPPWWDAYLAKLKTCPEYAKNNDATQVINNNEEIACMFASSDLVASLDDEEAIQIHNSLTAQSATAGKALVEFVLDELPSRDHFAQRLKHRDEMRQKLNILL